MATENEKSHVVSGVNISLKHFMLMMRTPYVKRGNTEMIEK